MRVITNGVYRVCVYVPLQMLFYESAKCLHGRMSALKGKYYAGFFVHYKVLPCLACSTRPD